DGDLGIRLTRVPSLEQTPPEAALTYTGDIALVASGEEQMHFDDFGNAQPFDGAGAAPGTADIFHGRPDGGNTRFSTLDGNDYVAAVYGGNDALVLGRGMDFGFGGSGNDWIEGGADPDLLLGGAGDDVVI